MPGLPHEGEHLAAPTPTPVPQPAAAPSAVTDSQLTDTQIVDWLADNFWTITPHQNKWWVVITRVGVKECATLREAAIAALRAAPGAKL